jgi:amino acid transporter
MTPLLKTAVRGSILRAVTSQPNAGDRTGHTRRRAIISVVMLVVAAVLAPVVFIAGFAWPLYESLFCESSCGHSRVGSIVIWVLGAALVAGLTFLGVRGIVRTPQPPRATPP